MNEEIKYIVTCTSLAAEKIKEQIIKRNNLNTKGIRLGLRAGGCFGYQILFDFVDELNEKDHIFNIDGVSIFVDAKSIMFLNGTEIDFTSDLMGHGFKFNVPKQKQNCSCRASINF